MDSYRGDFDVETDTNSIAMKIKCKKTLQLGYDKHLDKLWLNMVKMVDNINYCLMSIEPYFSYIQDKNKLNNV